MVTPSQPPTHVTVTLDQLTLQTLQMGLTSLQVNTLLAINTLNQAVQDAMSVAPTPESPVPPSAEESE
jgi:hypothetical protein